MSGLRRTILAWYGRSKRDLPWRRTRDPYAIWVSEIMLQQTRVGTVAPFYERFLRRFPDVRALARAREPAVLAAWSGLGYYRRARNLHAAARAIVKSGGGFPRTYETLLELPGIGGYTAAAIASIAFGEARAAVDGNVIRVLARLRGFTGRRDSPALRARVANLAEAMARGPGPGDWTQALMELGAVICLPRDPLCDRCPAARSCVARKSGNPTRYPEALPLKTPKAERRLLLLASAGERILVVPDEAEPTTWSLPWVTIAGSKSIRHAALALAGRHVIPADGIPGPRATFKHRTFSHDLSYEVWSLRVDVASRRRSDSRWATPAQLRKLPLRAPTLKAMRLRGR